MGDRIDVRAPDDGLGRIPGGERDPAVRGLLVAVSHQECLVVVGVAPEAPGGARTLPELLGDLPADMGAHLVERDSLVAEHHPLVARRRVVASVQVGDEGLGPAPALGGVGVIARGGVAREVPGAKPRRLDPLLDGLDGYPETKGLEGGLPAEG